MVAWERSLTARRSVRRAPPVPEATPQATATPPPPSRHSPSGSPTGVKNSSNWCAATRRCARNGSRRTGSPRPAPRAAPAHRGTSTTHSQLRWCVPTHDFSASRGPVPSGAGGAVHHHHMQLLLLAGTPTTSGAHQPVSLPITTRRSPTLKR